MKMIFLAVWDHKHGQDVSAHVTEDGAQKQLVIWARENLEEWVYPKDDWDNYYTGLNDGALIKAWPEVTGNTEFFRVDEVQLHEDN
jgi:hypothetical protein